MQSPVSHKKILFLTRCLDIGGAQRQLVELALGLRRMGWLVIVGTFYRGGTLEPLLQAEDVPIFSLDKKGRWDILGCLWRLRARLRKESPHVAYGCADLQGILLNLVRPRSGITRVVWAIPSADMDLSFYDWLSRLEFHLGVFCSRFADLIIFNSEAGKRYHVARGFRPPRLVVIPNGVDLERYQPDCSARRDVRMEWGLSEDKLLVGLVGRLDPMKDHANFLHAAAGVSAVRADVRFVCVGDGPPEFRRKLVQMAMGLNLKDRLIWAGERNDIWRIYPALDLAVSSSMSEGLPNVILEAMATGVPCVVTDVGDSAKVVGDTGWICRPGDSLALKEAMLRALSALPRDPRSIRQRTADCYGTPAMIGRTATCLSELLKPVRPRAGGSRGGDAAR